MVNSHVNAYFEVGDKIVLERSPYVPKAEVLDIIEDGEQLLYRLKWSNGNINTKPVPDMDAKATNA